MLMDEMMHNVKFDDHGDLGCAGHPGDDQDEERATSSECKA